MTIPFDGFCDDCRRTSDERTDNAASKCGHETPLKDAAFCISCALKFGACRRCGKLCRTSSSDPRSGEP